MTLVVRTAVWDEWDGLVDRFEERTVFHRKAWLESLEQAYGLRALPLKVLDGDDCVAVWPWLWFRKALLKVVGSPLPGWSTPYMGPLFDRKADPEQVAREVLASGALGGWVFAACRTLDHGRPIGPPNERFREVRRFETYAMDLKKDEETLWGGLKSSCRSRIRKARKAGLEVRVETDDGYLTEFWAMAQGVFARGGRQPTYSLELLHEVQARLAPAGELLAISAWHEGARVATLILPHDDKTAMYWAGGARGDALDLAPNNLLHWEAILESKRRGLGRYDFISTKGGPGRFKKTFGPDAVEVCTHWEAVRPALLLRARDLYERRARRARRV